MKKTIKVLAIAFGFLATSVFATSPTLDLGAKPAMGLFQPRVSVEILHGEDGSSLGPNASSFLLDTGASGILIYPPATGELEENGFVNDGTYDEIGVGGVDTYNLSAPYGVSYQGTDGLSHQLENVRMLSGESAPDPTGLMGLNGIIGMPAMTGRVTSIDNRTRDGALSLSMGVEFSDELPATGTHRFTVPLKPLDFPTEGDIVPTFSPLSTLELIGQHGDVMVSDDIVLDSGAQISIISSAWAIALGLDTDGDGNFENEATNTVPLTGASGTVNAPVVGVDEFRIPTNQGFEMKWTDAEVVVFDIHPTINGVLGADFMTDDGGLDLSLVGGSGSGLGDLLGGGDLGDLFGDLFGGGDGGLGDLFGDLLGGGDDGGLGGLGDLLGGLGGLGDLGGLLGGGGGSDLFASFPLESYFDRVHFDFTDFDNGNGNAELVFDVNPEISVEILNGDHVFDAYDIDDLTEAIGSSQGAFDLDGDGEVTIDDRDLLISDVFNTVYGDSDLDGDVDFTDFLALSGSFGESDGWAAGDFDGNGNDRIPRLSGAVGELWAGSFGAKRSRAGVRVDAAIRDDVAAAVPTSQVASDKVASQ